MKAILVLLMMATTFTSCASAKNIIDLICQDDVQAVKQLLENGASPDFYVDTNVSPAKKYFLLTTIYDEACGRPVNELELTKTLFSFGANLNVKSDGGVTPLMMAVSASDLESVKFMIANGARVNDKDDMGQTALMYVSSHNDAEGIVKYMLESGADPRSVANDGKTALNWALKVNPKVAKYLLSVLK